MSDSIVPIEDIAEDNTPSEGRSLLDGSLHELKDLKWRMELLPTELAFYESLFDTLKNGQEERFLSKYRSANLIREYYQIQLLRTAIEEKKSEEVIDTILSNVSDINYPVDGEYNRRPYVIESICLANNLGVFKKLLQQGKLNLPPVMEILKTLISELDESLFNEWFDCLYFFKKVDVNEVDNENRTLLWYALWEENTTAVQKLLQKEAYIGAPVHFDNYFSFRKPLNPLDIKERFDSCITSNFVITKKVIFNYRNLVPPKKNNVNEMEAIMLILNSKEHSNLLKHPLITSFMALKWQRMAKCLYINLFLYCVYLVSFATYIIFVSKHFGSDSVFVILTWLLTILGIVYLVSRELVQLFAPKQYFGKPSNYFELVLIGLSICAIKIDIESPIWKEIVVSAIIFMVIVLCNLIENFPIVFVSTHILMLQEVLKSFLKSFIMYSIFVFMFALCFYILYGVEQNKTASTSEHRFGNLSTSIIKTMGMFVGELDQESMELKTDFCRNIVFLLFVICMPIVLMNLLNGLAVRDIQEIRDQAELNGLISRAKFLRNHDYKLFPHHTDENEYEEGESQFCSCKYTCIVEPEYLNFPNKISLPERCTLCFEKYTEIDKEKHMKRSTTKQRIWSRIFQLKNMGQMVDLWIETPTVMESSIVKESINVIINKEKESSDTKTQLKEKAIMENNAHKIQEIYNRVENLEPNAQGIENKVQNVEQKVENMEKNVQNIEQKVENMEKNVQNIEQKVQNIERNVQNIEQNVQNVGKNVEKILNNFKLH